jgi:hypothetical protein
MFREMVREDVYTLYTLYSVYDLQKDVQGCEEQGDGGDARPT